MSIQVLELVAATTVDLTNANKALDTLESRFQSTSDKIGREGASAGDAYGDGMNASFERAFTKAGQIAGSGIKGIHGALTGDIGALAGSFNQIVSGAIGAIPQVGQGLSKIYETIGGIGQQYLVQAFAYNDQLKLTSIQLELASGSADKAKRSLGELTQFAQKSPFSALDLAQTTARLENFGLSAERATQLTKSLGTVAAATGGDVGSLGTLLSRVLETGKIDSRTERAFINQGVSLSKIIASAMGTTKEEAERLIKANVITPNDFFSLFMKGADAAYGDAAQRAGQTYANMGAKFGNETAKRFGEAVRPAQEEAIKGIGVGIDVLGSEAAKQSAAGFATLMQHMFITPGDMMLQAVASGNPLASIQKMLPKGLMEVGTNAGESLAGGVTGASDLVSSAFSLLGNIGISTVKSVFGMHSPSTVMIDIGENLTSSLLSGMLSVPVDATATSLTNAINIKVTEGLTKHQKDNLAAFQNLTAHEQGFLPKLTGMAQARGIDPNWLLNAMAAESSFNPHVVNRSGYTGLIQLGAAARSDVGVTKSQLLKNDATWQLDAVFDYLDQRIKRFGAIDSQAKLYSAIGAGNFSADDNAIKFRKGQRGYASNKSWDVNHDGLIQQWEYGVAATRAGGFGDKITIGGIAQLNTQLSGVIDNIGRMVGGLNLPALATRNQTVGNPLSGLIDKFSDNLPAFGGTSGAPVDQRMVDIALSVDGLIGKTNEWKNSLSQTVSTLTGSPLVRLFGDILTDTTGTSTAFKQVTTTVAQATNQVTALSAANKDTTKTAGDVVGKYQGLSLELKKMHLTVGDFHDVFSNSFASAFSQTDKNFKQMLGSFALTFAQTLDQMVMKAVAADLADAIFGKKGTLGGISGGLLSGLFSFFGNLFNPASSFSLTNLSGGSQSSIPFLNIHHATGGMISGSGSGTSDNIPAWLSSGEYVENAAAVAKYGSAFMDSVNNGTFQGGGDTHIYGDTHIHVHVQGAQGQDPRMNRRTGEQIASAMVARLPKMRGARNNS